MRAAIAAAAHDLFVRDQALEEADGFGSWGGALRLMAARSLIWMTRAETARMVDGMDAIASRETGMALLWIGVDWDGGGGGAAEGAVAVRSAAEAEGDGDGDERPRVGRSW